jgi:holo-[acyl-carrier protein] synthase
MARAILGTGVDLQRIADMERAVRHHGERFLGRVFTPEEVADCRSRLRSDQSLAARFAAKEAFRKALGGSPGIPWHDIEVRRTQGAPTLFLHGAAQKVAQRRGVQRIHLSLSHSGDYAIAMVVIEGEP